MIAFGFRWIMSLLFIGQMYLMMFILAVLFFPMTIISYVWAFHAVRTYCRWVRFSARWMVGLHSEVRGEVPNGELLVCSKHQSFFDIIILVSVLPRPKFIMKAQLKWAPILGYFAWRMGCVPVSRGKKGKAVKQMIDGVKASAHTPGQLIIFPQGTRVAPGAVLPYKAGSGILYEGLGQDCVPAATNVGVFWPRHGVTRKPGLAVVEFLPVIKAGKPMKAFMAELEETIENHSKRLMAEAGYVEAD